MTQASNQPSNPESSQPLSIQQHETGPLPPSQSESERHAQRIHSAQGLQSTQNDHPQSDGGWLQLQTQLSQVTDDIQEELDSVTQTLNQQLQSTMTELNKVHATLSKVNANLKD
ncbi:hypothetical protein [Vibrio cionasavignyae]|uniref:hypothetical protein n=1 Tax=Vibrio cionasavignyae TaxID=2910252 RepID=UPI003D149207